jgi:hypothetical protein
MPRTLAVDPHLSLEELEQGYRAAADPVARSHWQMVWLAAQGRSCTAVGAVVGSCAEWVRTIVHRYNTQGPIALADRRHANPGQVPLLTAAQQETLRAALAGPAPDGGGWTGRQVADWIGAQGGRPVAEAGTL